MKNETVIFDTIVPHPAPVQISELLAEIQAVIKRHVVLNDHAAAALAVWVLHTYTFELRDTVAYVAIESPEKRCGKTTLLSVLAAMAQAFQYRGGRGYCFNMAVGFTTMLPPVPVDADTMRAIKREAKKSHLS